MGKFFGWAVVQRGQALKHFELMVQAKTRQLWIYGGKPIGADFSPPEVNNRSGPFLGGLLYGFFKSEEEVKKRISSFTGQRGKGGDLFGQNFEAKVLGTIPKRGKAFIATFIAIIFFNHNSRKSFSKKRGSTAGPL
ncbi:MAG: hypothetical protein PHW76_05400 [Alphaproteobacteria bacterium]|nr:hypothetical protein [Alphaproteobacteria bacterium]